MDNFLLWDSLLSWVECKQNPMQQARIYCAWLPSEIFPKYVHVRKGEKVRWIKKQEFYAQTQLNIHYLSIGNIANFIEFEIVWGPNYLFSLLFPPFLQHIYHI